MQNLFSDSITALFADHATPAAVRRAEKDGLDRGLWQLVTESGFDKALAPEALGGYGISLNEAGAVLEACGRFAAPIPLAEAMLAHGFAGLHNVELPAGAVTASLARSEGDTVRAHAVPWGGSADWVLAVEPEGQAFVFPVIKARSSLRSDIEGECEMLWRTGDARLVFTPHKKVEWRAVGAAMRVAQIAGALDSVLELTTQYAGERNQFGRALAKFQAIQQQVAMLAEDAFAARMASSLVCDSAGVLPDTSGVAAAKVVASEAAARASAIAHAIHGAMGITEEYDLQLFTRRLLIWRMQYGSESYWAARVGAALLDDGRTTWEFVRA
jgi:acyl-CoA dehydrogenase